MATLLQLHRTPRLGGDTIFANMYAAYDALSDQMKTYLRGCRALHDPERAHRGRFEEKGVDDRGRQFTNAIHPVVRTHPVSGRQALYVNEVFTQQIMDIPGEESDAILTYLFQHMARQEFQVRFQWRDNSVAFWDNRCTQHLAMWDYWPEERYGHRVTVKGDAPFFRPH
jgi:taurine dioxygenase